MNFKKTKIAIVGAVTALAMAGGVAVLPAFAADDVAAQIAALMAQIQMLQAKLASSQAAPVAGSYNFAVNLTVGSTGDDVMNLQKVLNGDVETQVAASGVGSMGNETKTFGGLTKAAVIKFQKKYGISPAVGYVGPITRAKLNSMFAVAPSVPGTPAVPATPGVAGTLVVTAASMQPANALAPAGATRIPFTKFTVTAGATDVPLSSVVVERTGSSVNAALESVVLVDENGVEIGLSKTLNSSNRATIGEPILVKAGTSRTLTVAGNRAAAGTLGGMLIGLDVVAINTTATVVGDVMPIKGATHTVNESLIIGTVTMGRGSIDPGANQTKEIGSVGYTFSSVRVTAGPAEALTLKSVRWNQFGSASAADLANVKVYVDGVAYDAVTTDGGRYYTTVFGNGILVDKGFSKDISIKADIIGGSSRTVRFDIAKRTDVNLVGNLYGYGVLPPLNPAPACGTVACYTGSEDPWYKGAEVTMSNGTMNVTSDNTVASQNIAINLMNQPFGGWSIEVRGEPITVGKMVFTNSNASTDITNVVLVDGNGSVLAGPVDVSVANTITFTDTVTLPVGITKIAVKGKVGTTFATNQTISLTTNPSTQWTTVRGQVTGNSITPAPAAGLTAAVMTVKAGAVAISQSSLPVAQNVIAGATQFEFARYVLDAGQSGEDLRATSFIASSSASGASVLPTSLTNCQLYDGEVSITSGSNAKNPSANGDQTFIFDGTGLVIPKGTSKTLSLRCNVSSGVVGSIIWGLPTTAQNLTGLGSGQTIAAAITSFVGNTMTLAAGGSYTVGADSSEVYNYRVVRAGTEVSLAAFRFTASAHEDINVKQVALQIANTASSSRTDLQGQMVTLWDGATQVGTAQFTTSNFATSTLTGNFIVPKGGVKTLVVKGSLTAQDSISGTPGALLAIHYDGDNNGLDGNYSTGISSNSRIDGVSADVSTYGVRIFANVPTVTVSTTGGAGLGSAKDIYVFSVQNPGSRDIALKKVSFGIATSGGAVASDFMLYGGGVAAKAAVTQAPLGLLEVEFDNTSTAKVVPAGSSKSYTLRVGNVSNPTTVVDQLTVALLADANYPSLANLMGTYAEVAGSNFVWSPMSTTTLQANDATFEGFRDWTNGYGLPGFPGLGQSFPSVSWQSAN
jgi:hypothetical protein